MRGGCRKHNIIRLERRGQGEWQGWKAGIYYESRLERIKLRRSGQRYMGHQNTFYKTRKRCTTVERVIFKIIKTFTTQGVLL